VVDAPTEVLVNDLVLAESERHRAGEKNKEKRQTERSLQGHLPMVHWMI